jgi:2,3-dihydroxybenzoate decarboxylase
MERREFLRKAALAALAVPAALGGGAKYGYGDSGPLPAAQEGARPKMKRIAIEEHWGNKELLEIRAQWEARTGLPKTVDEAAIAHAFPRLGDFEKFRLPSMDEFDVTMQVLSIGSPGIQAISDTFTAIDVAKRTNDFQAEVIRKYPDRFGGFAALPTQDPKAAADELERAVTQLGFRGAMIQGHTHWEYLDEPKYWLIWERAAALEVPIYLHVNEPSLDSIKMYAGHSELLGPTWAWGVETATHALRIIGSGVFDAFPQATLILGHLGESLPYLLGRFDEGYRMALKPKKLRKRLSEYIRENFLVTTSGKYEPEALICAIKAVGVDRVLFAVDYPFVLIKDSVELLERTAMSDSDREKIYHLNAERWLKL